MARAVQAKPRIVTAEKLCVFVTWWFVALFSGDSLMNTDFPDVFSEVIFICVHQGQIFSL